MAKQLNLQELHQLIKEMVLRELAEAQKIGSEGSLQNAHGALQQVLAKYGGIYAQASQSPEWQEILKQSEISLGDSRSQPKPPAPYFPKPKVPLARAPQRQAQAAPAHKPGSVRAQPGQSRPGQSQIPPSQNQTGQGEQEKNLAFAQTMPTMPGLAQQKRIIPDTMRQVPEGTTPGRKPTLENKQPSIRKYLAEMIDTIIEETTGKDKNKAEK